jgi:SAM-dependent methyltransferase
MRQKNESNTTSLSGFRRHRSGGACDELGAAAVAFAALNIASFPTPSAMYAAVVSGMYRLVSLTDIAIAAGVGATALNTALAPALVAQGRSAFLSRIREWPRGFPGDFETIEYLIAARNTALPGTLEHVCEEFFLNSPAAYQHRNKLQAQADVLRATVRKNPAARVLVLGAGGGLDLCLAQDCISDSRVSLILNDIESDALKLCQQRFACMGERLELVEGNVFQKLREFADLGPYDLILAGGLLDYVPDTLLRRYLPRIIRDLLKPGGCFFFTNIAEGNPYRTWLEIFGNWRLIERNEEQIRSLLARAGCNGQDVEIGRKATRLAFLVKANRPADWAVI